MMMLQNKFSLERLRILLLHHELAICDFRAKCYLRNGAEYYSVKLSPLKFLSFFYKSSLAELIFDNNAIDFL